ncbi:MAG: hypothetical protein JXB60_01430 [Candidatus Cloacimonetes bacterium]|nr:hypothetical protein [Candidatus Cloacimonadota bacterium]
MISLDWIERLKKDTVDFYERKLPAGDYDIDIVYNAYPQRIDNKVPNAVLTLVGKTLGSIMAKDADRYFNFFNYLISQKGENGRIIFSYIMARAVRRKPDVFIDYIQEFLLKNKDQKTSNLLIDKAILPLFKKNTANYLELLLKWIKHDNSCLNKGMEKMLTKLVIYDSSLVRPIFHKLETSWLYATPSMIKFNSNFLKIIHKADPDFYLSIFKNYHNTRNPVFAEILSGAIVVYEKAIYEMVDNWTQSGNVNLKKIGQHAMKMLKKKKVKR